MKTATEQREVQRAAALSGSAARQVAGTRQRLRWRGVALADSIDLARFVGARDVATELARDPHELLDLLH